MEEIINIKDDFDEESKIRKQDWMNSLFTYLTVK
jgi:hypothetical protein